jgi:hypothetical protein
VDKEIKKEFEKIWGAINKLGSNPEIKYASKKQSRISISDLILSLKQEGFFNTPKSLKEIQDKLASKTYHYPVTSLTDPIKRLVRSGQIGRIKKDGAWHYAKR